MDDFMCWLYAHYIQPQIRLQKRDDADEFRFTLLEGENDEVTGPDIEAVLRFYACHGFLLGLKTGRGLSESAR